MAWTTPLTAVANATLTAAQWNASVRDNLAETLTAKMTTAGQYGVATATNAVAARIAVGASVATGQTTATTTSYGDLATVGPTCGPLTCGTQAFVSISSYIANGTSGGGGLMSYGITGASAIVADDSRAIRLISSSAGETQRVGITVLQTGITAGSNTFTAKYTTPTGGTATFTSRHMGVLPF